MLFLSLICTNLTACYDAVEVDNWAYVYSIGVDKGVTDKLQVTIQIATLKGQQPSSGQGSQENDFTVISQDCPTSYTGMNMINTSLSRKINYMHAKYFVVSEELAKEDIGYLMDAFIRDRQMRRTIHVIVAHGSAREFIKSLNPILGIAISKTLEGLMDQEDETGFFDDNSYGEFLNDMKNQKKQPIAVLGGVNPLSGGSAKETAGSGGDYYAGDLPRTGGNQFEVFGSAMFNGGRMVGELNGEETRMLLIAKGDLKRASFPLEDPLEPKYTDTLDVTQRKKPLIKISFKDGKPIIKLKVFLEADLQALQTNIEYEKAGNRKIMENAFKKKIEKEIDATINKLQNLNCDAVGFGEKASMHFLTIQSWEKYNWLNKFRDAHITTEVQFAIRRTGTMMKTNPPKEADIKSE